MGNKSPDEIAAEEYWLNDVESDEDNKYRAEDIQKAYLAGCAHKEKEMSAKVQKLIDEVEYHKHAYGLDIFPNSVEITSESTRESVSAFMGRHMCNAFLMYINSIFNFQKEGLSK